VDVNGVYTSPDLDPSRFTAVDGGGLEVPLPTTAPRNIGSSDVGDVNCDGSIGLIDAILIQQFDNLLIPSIGDC